MAVRASRQQRRPRQQRSRALAALVVAALCSVLGAVTHAAFAGGQGRLTRLRRTQVTAAPETVVLDSKPDVSELVAVSKTTGNARLSGLALMLDDGTRKSHSVAESTQFVTGFFKGLGDRESFSKLVTSLYFIYEAMESAFDATRDHDVKALDFPELRRLTALEADMEYFHGAGWRDSIQPSPATVRYCDQIRKVASENPYLLIGHQYSRYVGDLFGGQMMGGMAVKSLGLQEGVGTEFYQFKEISDTKGFIQKWYSTLNDLDLTKAQKEGIVDEANVVFRLNIDVFEELEGSPIAAAWQLFVTSLREKLGL